MKPRAKEVAESALAYAEREGIATGGNGTEPNTLAAILAERRFDILNPPPEEVPVYRLGDATIATAGNLIGVQAQAKAGKTALIGAMLAAAMGGEGDCLGMVSANPGGLALVHLDTEQSPAHFHKCILRALQRGALTSPPRWLRSYRLADVPLLTRRAAVEFELERATAEHGGIHSVIIDGVADLAADPNDPAEAFGLVDYLHQLAIRFAVPIVCILHENPGSESGKTRGHLGSQLERKAETNLRLVKDTDGITTIFADKARQAHIPREHGQRFKWCDEAKRHVSCESAGEARKNGKRELAAQMAKEAFRGIPPAIGMTWTQLVAAIIELEEVSNATARRRVAEWSAAKLIRLSRERYFLA